MTTLEDITDINVSSESKKKTLNMKRDMQIMYTILIRSTKEFKTKIKQATKRENFMCY